MAGWVWRSSLRLTRLVIFSRGGLSTFRRLAWGNSSAAKAPRSWQARCNTSGCPLRRSGQAWEYGGEVPPGERAPKLTLQKGTTVSRKADGLVPTECELCPLLEVRERDAGV